MELSDDMKGRIKAAGIHDCEYGNLIKANRFAVAPRYRDSSVFWSLIMFGLELANQTNLKIVYATPYAHTLIRIAGAQKLGNISYDSKEAKSPTLIFFDQNTLNESIIKLNASFTKLFARSTKTIESITHQQARIIVSSTS